MSTPGEQTPQQQYEPYNPQNPPSNPAAYQPLYNQSPAYQQPYAQPYQYPTQQQQQYQQYQQPQQYQPGFQPPQYGTGQYQTAYVVQPTSTYCVEETHCKTSNGTGIGWILFIIGFFLPICWLIGSFFLCSSNHMDRRAGRANLIGLLCLVTFLTIFFITTQN